MKTKNIFSVCIILALGVFFAACGTYVDITKRHFNDGYYVHAVKKHAVSKNEAAADSRETAKIVSEDVNNKSETEVSSDINSNEVSVPENNNVFASANNKPAIITNEKRNGVIRAEENNTVKSPSPKLSQRKQKRFERRAQKINSYSERMGNAPAIVLIILCIFLPFIAVGIVDDWGTRFLISILLWLLFILPGIIYAFIVCFG